MKLHARSLALLTLLSLSLASVGAAPAGETKAPAKAADPKVATKEPIEWLAFSDGLKLAHEKKRPVIVDVYTSWCGWCKRMDATTYRDEKVIQALNNSFVVVKVNAESNNKVTYKGEERTLREICGSAWGISGYPTTVFLTPEGEVITPLGGYIPAERFEPILRYIGSGAYESMKFDEFLKKKNS